MYTAEKGWYILSGPVRSGKTSSIIQWSQGKELHGILTPDINGTRSFMNAFTKEIFAMEAAPGEADTLNIGRFVFSKKNFDRAVSMIRSAIHSKGWLIIDEIGPLELDGEGFHNVLQEVVAAGRKNVILVVREGLVDRVIKHFAINCKVLNSNSLTHGLSF